MQLFDAKIDNVNKPPSNPAGGSSQVPITIRIHILIYTRTQCDCVAYVTLWSYGVQRILPSILGQGQGCRRRNTALTLPEYFQAFAKPFRNTDLRIEEPHGGEPQLTCEPCRSGQPNPKCVAVTYPKFVLKRIRLGIVVWEGSKYQKLIGRQK